MLTILYIVITFPLAFLHESITRRIGKFFSRQAFFGNGTKTYWTIVDTVRNMRGYVILVLSLSVICMTYGINQNLTLFTSLFGNFTEQYEIYGIVMILITYLIPEIFDRVQTVTDHHEHPDKPTIQNIIENLSITAGITPPKFVLYAGSVPKLFLHVPLLGKPQLYVSTSFLQYFDSVEAEAYIAHEIGHYLSKGTSMQRAVAILLTVFKISGAILFLLFLAYANPVFPLFWLGFYSMLVISTLDPVMGLAKWEAKFLMLIINPVHLATVLISGCIHYTMNYGEMIYADLKALELTRYPQGLYSALNKVLLLGKDAALEKVTYYNATTYEKSGKQDESFEQQLIEERLKLIKTLDQTVTTSHSPPKALTCGICTKTLVAVHVQGPHNVPSQVWACHTCSFLWFDQGSFYTLSSIDTRKEFSQFLDISSPKQSASSTYLCPRCLVALSPYRDKNLPGDIHIYDCSSCQGNGASASDFVQYTQHRLSLKTTRQDREV